MTSHNTGSDDYNDSFTTHYPHSLRTRGTSPYAPNRSATFNPTPTISRRPPIPEDFQMDPETQTELIDTAIVIKNIPFSYPEEDFVSILFPQLGLVPPYAFNYHRNKSDRAFHGLAFANFNTANEAQAAVDVLNNYELDRRRLRVELKKRLPAEEEQRQRLARQSKRQLTHQTASPTGFQLQPMMGQEVQSPQPVEAIPTGHDLNPALRPRIVYQGPPTPTPQTELDMNDPDTLGFYTEIQLFRNNPEATTGATLQFPPTLSPQQRRIVHSLAIKLNLDHLSQGTGQDRFVTVFRRETPPLQHHLQQHQSGPLQSYRPLPTTRASTEHLGVTTPHSPLSPRPDLRASRSLTNLRSSAQQMPPPPVPQLPTELTTFPYGHDLFALRLSHRSSQESAVSSNRSLAFGRDSGMHTIQPTRQPHGPPQEQSRGFMERPSRESFNQIRPIGHGAKTPSHGSLSHGSGSRESRGGSDSILDL